MEPMTTPERPVGTGYLTVQVTTASSAIPLAGAQVTISDSNNRNSVLHEQLSGKDGKTPRVALPAPPRALSERPQDAPVFAPYHIAVFLQGYERAEYNNVPIYDGVTSVQQVDLIPVPDNRYPDGFTVKGPNLFETTEPTL